ncbi:MAG: putative quinol monooxygenase [Aureliella sp.]|jgi:quinol monooxygenase YgiN
MSVSKPKCAVCVTFSIKHEHIEQFREAVRLQAKNSLEKESWCHQFDVCTDPTDPTKVLLYETYDDRAAFDKHRQTDHFAQFSLKVADWVADKQLGVWDIH